MGLFGGSSNTTVVQSTAVTVEVNPNIVSIIELEPVQNLVDVLSKQTERTEQFSKATLDAVLSSAAASAAATTKSEEAKTEAFGALSKNILLGAAVIGGVMLYQRSR